MPNGFMSPRIFLFSSNARAKYFDDCLQALMLPRGMVLHFRYRLDYLDPQITKLIGDKKLVGERVVVCYLFQELENGEWTPRHVRPLRVGSIVDVQVNGPSVHLYFAVDSYPLECDPEAEIARLADRGGSLPGCVWHS